MTDLNRILLCKLYYFINSAEKINQHSKNAETIFMFDVHQQWTAHGFMNVDILIRDRKQSLQLDNTEKLLLPNYLSLPYRNVFGYLMSLNFTCCVRHII